MFCKCRSILPFKTSPGGFGAAKNLSNFAVEGPNMEVDGTVSRVLKEFHGAGKPIGLCCIAPVIAAKVFEGVEVTVGMRTFRFYIKKVTQGNY